MSAKVAVSGLRSAIGRPATGLFRPSLRPRVLAPSRLARRATRRLRRSVSVVSRGGSFEGGTSDSLASEALAGHLCAVTVGGLGLGLRSGNAGTSATRWIRWWDEKSCRLRAGTRPQEAEGATREGAHSVGCGSEGLRPVAEASRRVIRTATASPMGDGQGRREVARLEARRPGSVARSRKVRVPEQCRGARSARRANDV